MAAGVLDHANGIITLKISGKLTQSELASIQAETAGLIGPGVRWRILVLTENFAGWELGGEWNDFSAQSESDASIEKMAIVGERRWEELALIFTAKGLRPFPIEFFEPAQLPQARAWLTAN
jgi:SpoIIAA-like